MGNIKIYTDGGARGNPGPAAIGVVFANEKGETIKKCSNYLGETTNNIAEYEAVIFAMQKAKAFFGKEEVKKMSADFLLDSELVVKQLNHEYKIQEENLQTLFLKIWNLMLDFGPIKFFYIPREKNKEADALVNEELDKQESAKTLF